MNEVNNGRFAYLIIAHSEPYILEKLVGLLDDVRNDIFILIDKKSDRKQFQNINTCHSPIIWCDSINIHWGDTSQIQAEFILFEKAYSTRHYTYYHLLSGVDLPIKTQNYIHEFFSNKDNNGKEYIGYSKYPSMKNEIERKTQYYHFFTKYGRSKHSLAKKIIYVINKISISLQRLLKVKRTYPYNLKKGSNWCSLTENAVRVILHNKNKILKQFKYTLCADEIFLHSFIWNNYNRDIIVNDNLRLIDWQRGSPYTFNINDIAEIKKSDKLFARKFSTVANKEKQMVDAVYNFISENKD